MFGTSPRLRRPLLLVLVYGAFLALVGITATAQSVMVSAHFSTAMLNDVPLMLMGLGIAKNRILIEEW